MKPQLTLIAACIAGLLAQQGAAVGLTSPFVRKDGSRRKVFNQADLQAALRRPTPSHADPWRSGAHPSSANCTVKFFDQNIDHYGLVPPPGGVTTYKQRYFVCDEYWKRPSASGTGAGPIFFYTGNEADVTLYVNQTGLMWDNAPQFGALLVFAEHRYFGESSPYPVEDLDLEHMQYLTTAQALHDYAVLVRHVKESLDCHDSPVVSFGGSYGGMLASWARIKFPGTFDGAIAGSAPILAFEGETPAADFESFNRIMTEDASTRGGNDPQCAANVRDSWKAMMRLGQTAAGRSTLQSAMNLCYPLKDLDAVYNLRDWASTPLSFYAMGSYSWPSQYMLNGQGTLPPFPMTHACNGYSSPFNLPSQDEDIVAGLAQFIEPWYNNSGDQACYNLSAGANPETTRDDMLWDFLACTFLDMPASQNGVDDFLWYAPWNDTAYAEGCLAQWGVAPRRLWPQDQYGGKQLQYASNIVFSNGYLDPWIGTGVSANITGGTGSVVAYIVEDCGHHCDLMFPHEQDNESLKGVRQLEVQHIREWVTNA